MSNNAIARQLREHPRTPPALRAALESLEYSTVSPLEMGFTVGALTGELLRVYHEISGCVALRHGAVCPYLDGKYHPPSLDECPTEGCATCNTSER